MNSKLLLTLALGASLTTTALRAANYVEPGDAGQTLGTAANTTATGSAGTSLNAIIGSVVDSAGLDADVYLINIASASTFFATVTGSTLDTTLFLFDLNGRAIVTNDDANGSTLQSALRSPSALNAGNYYLAISLSGNEPVNSANQLLFAGYPSGDTTAQRGPAANVSPDVLSNFNGNTSFAESGTYTIDLAVTAVPEPATWALVGAGALALGVGLSRRRRELRAAAL